MSERIQMEKEHFEARLEGVSLNGIGNYRIQKSWWGPSAFLLFVELRKAIFGVLGLCIRKSVAQWSEPEIILSGGAGLWDRYYKSSHPAAGSAVLSYACLFWT